MNMSISLLKQQEESVMHRIPYLVTNNERINRAYRMAVANLFGNIQPFQSGVLEQEEPCIIAGLGYVTPWTRDTAINVWNGGGLLFPDVALNTLKAVLKKTKDGYAIDGEYWDCIIWAIGAWWQYLYTGDKAFLAIAHEAVVNSLAFFEKTEFNEQLNLFRGAACYGDGVAAYPDIYASNGFSGIISFATENKDLCEKKGVGIPLYALSTNCLYYYAYVLADKMAAELGKPGQYAKKADAMARAINAVFWNEKKGTYNYLYDKFGGCDYQEGLGISFAILFGIADEEKKASIFKNTVTSPHGIPCVYPSFARYDTPDGMGFGRHSGTVWPHVQGYWADAAAENQRVDLFDQEFQRQTDNAVNSGQFAEIYHPLTGAIYGGRQEDQQKGIREWVSEPHQTWSATAYLRDVYMDLVGLKFQTDGIRLAPVGSRLADKISLKNLAYRNMILNVSVTGHGNTVRACTINGKKAKPFVPHTASGIIDVKIELA